MALYRVIPEGDVKTVDGQVQVATGADYVRTKLAQRFRFFLGEWFLDLRKGVPYYRDVLGRSYNVNSARAIFRSVLRSMPEIATIVRFDLVFDRSRRSLSFDFEVTLLDGGTVIVRPTDDDFILLQIGT